MKGRKLSYGKQREKEGLKQVLSWIPVEDEAKHKRYVKKLRRDAGKPLPRDL
jgi:hypothetical protein